MKFQRHLERASNSVDDFFSSLFLRFGVVYVSIAAAAFQWAAPITETTMPDTENELGVLILAGGQSARMGKHKALLDFKGQTFIECIVDLCVPLGRHIVVSVGQAQGDRPSLRARFESNPKFSQVVWVEDEHDQKGPMAGIEAGLKSLQSVCRYAFVTGCDVPVLKTELAKELLHIANQNDARAVTPVDGKRIFGMTAIYRTDSWQVASELIQKNSLRVSNLAEQLSATKVELADLREFDPKLESFLNINHPQAYRDFLISQGCDVSAEVMKDLRDS